MLHVKTEILVHFSHPDGKGNARLDPPIRIEIADFNEDEFRKAFAAVAKHRESVEAGAAKASIQGN